MPTATAASLRKNCVLQVLRHADLKAQVARAARAAPKVGLRARRTVKKVVHPVVAVVHQAVRKAVPRVLRMAKVGPRWARPRWSRTTSRTSGWS
jgi:hypothetical protein